MGDARGRILVVEDDEEIRECLLELLEDEGYAVTLAEHGQEALERVDEAPPDLILLDLMMPVMNGFEFLRVVRQTRSDEVSRIPVVVVTAAGEAVARSVQASGVVAKPIDVDVLLAVVERLLAATAS